MVHVLQLNVPQIAHVDAMEKVEMIVLVQQIVPVQHRVQVVHVEQMDEQQIAHVDEVEKVEVSVLVEMTVLVLMMRVMMERLIIYGTITTLHLQLV